MKCNNCGNESAHAWKVAYSKEGRFESCNACGFSGANVGLPDVIWKGPGYDSNIVDKMGNEIFIESRKHKAQLLKERGMREANDRVHGAPGHRLGTK